MWYGIKAPRFEELATLARATRARKIPCVSPENGYFLYTMVQATGAKRVLEIGTATGVSTLYLAEGVGADGHIDTIEKNAVDAAEARVNCADTCIVLHEGNALEVLQDLRQQYDLGAFAPYDLVFIDAMKREYVEYVQLVLPMLRSGGLIIFDDVIAFGHKMENLFAWLKAENIVATIVPTDPDDGVLLLVKPYA